MIDKPKEKRQKKKSEEALQISEDRLQLLDTIHEIVNVELDNRGDSGTQSPPRESATANLWIRTRQETLAPAIIVPVHKEEPIPTIIVLLHYYVINQQ